MVARASCSANIIFSLGVLAAVSLLYVDVKGSVILKTRPELHYHDTLQSVEMCYHRGRWYPPGRFWADACTPCWCAPSSGASYCAIFDCKAPDCVDPVRDPSQCCPVCPSGPSCEAPDGTVIRGLQPRVIASMNVTCKCSHTPHVGMTTVCWSTDIAEVQ